MNNDNQFNLQRLKAKLVRAETTAGRGPSYGSTNQAFSSDDVLSRNYNKQQSLIEVFDESPADLPVPVAEGAAIVAEEDRGEERESWDSKITFLLATIG